MCLALPMKLLERELAEGVAECHSVRRRISLMLTPEARAGDWLLVHAGYSIGVLDEEEACHALRELQLFRPGGQGDIE